MNSPKPQFKNSPAPQFKNSPAPQFKNSPTPQYKSSPVLQYMNSPKPQFKNSPMGSGGATVSCLAGGNEVQPDGGVQRVAEGDANASIRESERCRV
ncbi:hypothetical protein glysoja_000693 [Glycine soja]|nr:hypothetical protein glysoja_000693 [Glycine soja]